MISLLTPLETWKRVHSVVKNLVTKKEATVQTPKKICIKLVK